MGSRGLPAPGGKKVRKELKMSWKSLKKVCFESVFNSFLTFYPLGPGGHGNPFRYFFWTFSHSGWIAPLNGQWGPKTSSGRRVTMFSSSLPLECCDCTACTTTATWVSATEFTLHISREVPNGVGAGGVGVKFPIFPVNCSRLPFLHEKNEEKRRKTKKKWEKFPPTPSTPTPLRNLPNIIDLLSEEAMGCWKKEGGGKPLEWHPSQKGVLDPPLVRYVFPPHVSVLCFPCTKIHDREDQKLFWTGPKIFRESVFSGTFSCPDAFCTRPYHSPILSLFKVFTPLVFEFSLSWFCHVTFLFEIEHLITVEHSAGIPMSSRLWSWDFNDSQGFSLRSHILSF